MRVARIRPSNRLFAFTLLCLLAIFPLFTGKSNAATVAATPAFSLLPGTYTLAQKVTITDATVGATIYYTVNGTTPTVTPSELYSGPVTVSASATLEAIAVAPLFTQSATATAAYTIISPQLQETAVSTTTTAVNVGGTIPVSDTAANLGQAPAGASTTRYYLSTTTGKTASSYLLSGTRAVPALAASLSSAGSATVSVPTGVLHATYYLVACADDTGTVAETNTGTNCKATTTTIAVSGADLEETAVSTTTTAVNISGTISVTDTAANLGQVASAASVTRYYLSTNKTTRSYLLTGSRAVPALPAPPTGNASTATVTVSVPTGVLHATYYLLACADDTGVAAETNTGNNCMAASTTIVVSGADLEETAVSTTTTAVNIGGTISVTDTASNLGQVASAVSVTRYYLSTTTGKTSSSYLLTGSRAVPALPAPPTGNTSTATVTVSVPTGVLHATYYLLACADDTGVAAETNTSNNCSAASTTVAVSGADLEETAVSTTTTAANISGTISVTDTASNLGQVASAASVTRYYLSTNKTTRGYLLTGSRPVPALPAPPTGNTSTATVTVSVPTGVLHATYYLLACADDTGVAAETNTSNNCMAAGTTIAISGADLEETAVSTTTTAVNISGFINVTDTTANLGQTASAISLTRYYLSTTTSKTSSSYLLLGTRAVPALPAPPTGNTSTGTIPVTVPSGVLHGTYYLLACADDTGVAAETNTSNNCKAASTTIVVSGPDLVETAVGTTTTVVNLGGSIAATDTVENTGQVSAAASVTRYYLSTTTSKTTSSYLLTGSRSVPALVANTSATTTPTTGSTSAGSATLTVPTGVPHATYYLLACADDTGTVGETHTGNCIAAGTTIAVSGPDLVETAVSIPPTALNIGSSFSVTDTAENIGQVSASAFATGYYLSTTTSKSTSSYLLTGTRSVPALVANTSTTTTPTTGSTSTGTVTVSVPSSVPNGSYYLLACANTTGSVDVINIANNCKASSSVTVVSTGLQITGTTPSAGTVGVSYPAWPLGVSGGTAPYTWSISAGALPGGLTLSPATISGLPTTSGTFNFSVKVTDSSSPQKTGIAAMSMTINLATLTLNLPSTLTLATGTVGESYSAAINATGTVTATTGTYNYNWTVNGASVPSNGMALTLSNGIAFTNTGGWTLSIGGTPTTSGPVTFSVSVTACTPSSSGCVNTSILSGSVSYTITVNGQTALSLPSPLTLPTGTVGQGYSGAINAIGGDQKNYIWTVNGTAINTNGTPLTLSNGIAFSNTGGYTLSIGGTPNAAGTVSFTASVKDVAPNTTAGPVTYSITTNQPGSPVNGQIFLNNNCGNATMPPITVSINTSPVQTTTTDSNGNFSFQGVPNGTYTITPSIVGPSSVFYPATQSVSVNNNTPSATFNVSLGYTVTGTVGYSGTQTGRIYVTLNNNNCGGTTSGTSIAAKGSFTIHGVPPGNYTLQAWMDDLGYGAQNTSNPTGSLSNETVSDANLTGLSVTLTDPAAVTLSSPPSIQLVSGFNDGAVVQYSAIQSNNNNGNSVEMAKSYTLQWSTSSSFASVTGNKTFAATGANGNNVWFFTGLTDGTAYYFRLQGVASTSTSPWSSIYGPVTINAPTAANTVSGAVTFTGTATGPLYAGFYDQSTNNVYATSVASPVSPQAFTVEVPTGSNYCFFGIVDQNNDGVIDPGDITNTGGNCPNTAITASVTGKSLTLPSADSSVSLTTQHQRQTNSNGTNDSYQLNFNVNALIKLPVAVTLLSGLDVISPMDIGQCSNCGGGGNGSYSFWIGLNSAVPKVGDAYSLQVTYSDGTSQTLTASVATVLSAFATNMAPSGSSASVDNLTPTFTWTDPASASSYTYQFYLWDNNGNTIWQIPGNNSKSNGFPSTTTSIVWGTDPTGGGSTPSVNSLTTGVNYNWQIQAQDNNGNSASMQVSYQP